MELVGAFFVWVRAGIAGNLIPILAAAIAIWGVVTNRLIARRRATIDLIGSFEKDEGLLKAKKRFNELTKEDGGLAKWADEKHWASEQTESIRIVLNQFELVAVGVQRGILDLEIYKRWYKQGVLRHWAQAAPFVMAMREKLNNPMVFYEFEQLVMWLRDYKAPHRSWWRGLFF